MTRAELEMGPVLVLYPADNDARPTIVGDALVRQAYRHLVLVHVQFLRYYLATDHPHGRASEETLLEGSPCHTPREESVTVI